MKKPLKETGFGKVLKAVLTVTADTHPLVKLVKKVILGGVFESIPMAPAIKKVLDVNGDGVIDMKDIRDLKWDDIGKIVVIAVTTIALVYFGVLK